MELSGHESYRWLASLGSPDRRGCFLGVALHHRGVIIPRGNFMSLIHLSAANFAFRVLYEHFASQQSGSESAQGSCCKTSAKDSSASRGRWNRAGSYYFWLVPIALLNGASDTNPFANLGCLFCRWGHHYFCELFLSPK